MFFLYISYQQLNQLWLIFNVIRVIVEYILLRCSSVFLAVMFLLVYILFLSVSVFLTNKHVH